MSDKETIKWINSLSVFNVVKKATNGEWSWTLNSSCKYIELRIDMRDGYCILKNRNGEVINLDQLEHQFERGS